MVVRRRPPLLLLLCLAALAVSVAGKKCRDRKTAKGCVKKRDKGFCQEEATCPKPKKDGKKCKQTRKKCSLTCGLCTPGIDPVTNQPINPNYDPQSTVLTDMLTACGCTAEVDGVDMRPTSAAPYFCVKTELKGPNEDALTPVTICRGGHGAPNAPTCPGGEQVCGRSGYPSPPPSPSPSPPPTPTPPPSPPVVSPPSTPPTCTTSVSPITTRAALIAAMDLWCSAVDTTTLGDGVGGNAKDAAAKCAPSTWHVKMAAGVTLGLVTGNKLFTDSACDVTTWGSVPGDDMNGWDVSEVTNMDRLFEVATVFNSPLNAWDVGKVTSMSVRLPRLAGEGGARGTGEGARGGARGGGPVQPACLPAAEYVRQCGRFQPGPQLVEHRQGHHYVCALPARNLGGGGLGGGGLGGG